MIDNESAISVFTSSVVGMNWMSSRSSRLKKDNWNQCRFRSIPFFFLNFIIFIIISDLCRYDLAMAKFKITWSIGMYGL